MSPAFLTCVSIHIPFDKLHWKEPPLPNTHFGNINNRKGQFEACKQIRFSDGVFIDLMDVTRSQKGPLQKVASCWQESISMSESMIATKYRERCIVFVVVHLFYSHCDNIFILAHVFTCVHFSVPF